MDIEIVKPRDLPMPLMPYSPAVRAGKWLFLAGELATDFRNGVAPQARVPAGHPYSQSSLRLQTNYIYKNFEKVLRAAGTSFDNLVRIDQFYVTPTMLQGGSTYPTIQDYLEERDRWLKPPRPASTGCPIKNVLIKDALIEIDWIAIIPDREFKKSGVSTNRIATPLAGYAQSIKAGDYVFVAGMPASDFVTGLDPRARRNTSFWYGVDIKMQTASILDDLSVILQESGTDLKHVVYATVYLTDMRDVYGMDEVWRKYFPEKPPARSIVPFSAPPGMIPGSIIEITATAILPDGKLKKEVIRTDGAPRPVLHESQAVKAGDLVWLSGQMAADGNGLAREACILGKLDPNFPFYTTSPKRQTDVIIKNTRAICEAAGTSLKNVVKRQCFHTDYAHDFTGSIDTYFEYFPPGEGPASTTIEVQAPLSVPDCTVLINQIAYAPK